MAMQETKSAHAAVHVLLNRQRHASASVGRAEMRGANNIELNLPVPQASLIPGSPLEMDVERGAGLAEEVDARRLCAYPLQTPQLPQLTRRGQKAGNVM